MTRQSPTSAAGELRQSGAIATLDIQHNAAVTAWPARNQHNLNEVQHE